VERVSGKVTGELFTIGRTRGCDGPAGRAGGDENGGRTSSAGSAGF